MGLTRKESLPVHKDGEWIYDIFLTNDFEDLPGKISALGFTGKRLCIVTDSNVGPLYAAAVKEHLNSIATCVEIFTFPAGEDKKNLDTVKELYTFLIEKHFDRKDCLLALGGGVVGDLTGYTAATYLRGIAFIQIPTSLLSLVDSSIGGKTGVDFDSYKNMVGAFHMPKLVYMNLSVLHTLPDRQFNNGMAEIIKHGLIRDKAYYEFLKTNREAIISGDYESRFDMILRSCEIKRNVVENDPYEQGERAHLNFGHTLGHAIEKLMDFRLLHGECVAVGSALASRISMEKGSITSEEYEDILDTFISYGLPVKTPDIDAETIVKVTKSDKKMESGTVKFILLERVGSAIIDRTVTDDLMLSVL